jgi:hypothetical protein
MESEGGNDGVSTRCGSTVRVQRALSTDRGHDDGCGGWHHGDEGCCEVGGDVRVVRKSPNHCEWEERDWSHLSAHLETGGRRGVNSAVRSQSKRSKNV